MKTKWLLPLCLVASVAIIALADNPPTGSTTPNTAEIQSLHDEISSLRTRVQTLEDRTQKLESQVEKLSHPHLTPLLSPGTNPFHFNAPSPDPTRSKTWGQKEVNGWTVYVVPCGKQSQ